MNSAELLTEQLREKIAEQAMLIKTLQDRQAQLVRASSQEAEVEKRLFQTFFYQSHEIQFMIQNDRFIRVNNAFCDKFGYSAEELVDRDCLEFIDPEDINQTAFELDRLLRGEMPVAFNSRFKCRDGSLRTVSWHTNVDLENRIIIASVHDMTGQLAAEQQLRVLWLAMEQTSQSVAITDINHQIEYVNRAFCEISGYSEQEVLGQNPRILQSGKTPNRVYQEMFGTLQRGQTWEGEFINRRKNGEIYVELVLISPVRQANGRITNYLGIKQEITEYKRAMQEILESKQLLQTVMDSTPDWVHVKDVDHRYLIVNKSYAKVFNLEPAAMIGRRDEELMRPDALLNFHKSDLSGMHADDDHVLMGDSIHDATDTVVIDNSVRIFDTFKGPLRDAQQRVYGIISVSRDLTERLKNEQEQKKLEDLLLQSQKMELIGHLTGGIAHDFNNILASILGYAEILEMSADFKNNQVSHQYLGEIIRAGIRAKELVAQLLAFSHKRELAIEPIAVVPVLNEVMEMLKPTLPASMKLQYEFDANLPHVLISPVNLHQIIVNLVVNARDAVARSGAITVKAAPVGLWKNHLCTSCHREFSGDFLHISVRDNGTGITQENLGKIFDPFFTTKAIGKGTGLGLAVLHGIVHSALGHVVVDSIDHQGTQFNIYLPTHLARVEKPADETRIHHDHTQIHGNVMVVDDESSIVGFVTILLQNLGCHVTGFTSPAQALALFGAKPDAFDLVITDQSMPEITGSELAQAMLSIRADLPVILCTGYKNAVDEEAILNAGVRRLLGKPVPSRVLVELVTEYLGKPTRP